MANPISEVQKFGQSIWYDNIRRALITSGELLEMIDHDGLLGVTSNPAIFEKAVVGSNDYDQALRALVRQGVGDAKQLYERLAIEDIQLAADVLYPTHVRTGGRDGFISLEVSPYLARDTRGTIDEGMRLHAAVGRDNVMIKVPATPEGIPAIRELIGKGINVNVTLLFAVQAYEAAADAYIGGLETFAAAKGDVSKVNSVASFFLSRIDSYVDDKVVRALDSAHDPAAREQLERLMGKTAIANAKIAYARFREILATDRWKALAARGAKPQRVLWASTSTKNPKYPKTVYVDELIGADTVNTVPSETYTEFRAHGRVRDALTANWAESLEAARETIDALPSAATSIKETTDFLLADGVKKFADAFDSLLAAVEKKRQALLGTQFDKLASSIGDSAAAVKATLDDWRANGKVRRLWAGDTSLWTNKDEDHWLGWMHVVDGQREHPEALARIAEDAKSGGFKHIALLGMGGSSLCPDVLRRTFGHISGHPELVVLDSTVPAQVKTFESRLDPARTLFIVSSKSGSTTEPNVFKQYFFDKVQKALGSEPAGSRFVAITDPNTKMEQIARGDHFRHVFYGVPSIGGRYSALSNFGMVPAAAMGLDVAKFLDTTETMVQACGSSVPPEVNPGVQLGAIMGTLAKAGRDKVTIITSPAIGTLGAWLEQLIAESTGKLGKGLIPIDDERLGAPNAYGSDRLFAYVRLASNPSAEQDAAIAALEKAGHPVVRITLSDPIEIGQEFFRWEIATAVAGSIIGINAFDQPDVEASKVATRRLTSAYEQTGALPAETPILSDGGIALFTDPKNAAALGAAAKAKSVEGYMAAQLGRIKAGDYFAINAYVEMNDEHRGALQTIRHLVRDAKRVATTLGFGPRFLHSTGQLHKGGPNAGVFLQITSDDASDLPIPGQKYTFGVLKRAQAQGDFEVLAQRDRRALRVHLGADVRAGLAALEAIVRRALH